jgi:hypothetical protein
MSFSKGDRVYNTFMEKHGIITEVLLGGMSYVNYGGGPKLSADKNLEPAKAAKKLTASQSSANRARQAAERGAVIEGNLDFRGKRYDPSVDQEAAEGLRALLLQDASIKISCQKSAIPRLCDELRDTLPYPEQYIIPCTEESNGAGFDIIVQNTKKLREFGHRLGIYINPEGHYAKPSYDMAQIKSRALAEELIFLGMVPDRVSRTV